MDKKKMYLLGIGVLLVVSIAIGISYAYWMMTFQQTEKNRIVSSCFKMTFAEENDGITLNQTYPISDNEGKMLTPYTFTITNECDAYVSYQVNLEVLDNSTLSGQYVKMMLNDNIAILDQNPVVTKTLDNAITSYQIDTGYLDKKESKTYQLRLWLDENTPAIEETMNQLFASKVTIHTSYVDKIPYNTLAVRKCVYSFACKDTTRVFQTKYMENTTKIVFQNNMKEPASYVEVFDESEAKNGSIKAYVVENADVSGTYTIYFKTKEPYFYLPEDSTFYFGYFDKLVSIEGLEYVKTSNAITMQSMFAETNVSSLDLSHFDTSNVTNMSHMFAGAPSLTSLDLSSFDTSKVTNMSYMFTEMPKLSSLNVSSFDTSNVTDMQFMFDSASSLKNLDLSSFNTSKVTNMRNMFSKMAQLISLNVSSFDTSNVTDMQSMFFITDSNLQSLDLSSFNTSKVTTMNMMFCGLASLTSLDLSSFDTSNVTRMSNMFTNMSSLVSLNISSFDTSKVSTMRNMFQGCSSLTSLDLNHFDTVNVTDMLQMFSRMSNLTSLNISSFDTSKVTTMWGMFYDSTKLTNVTYGIKFIHTTDADVRGMYDNCPANQPTGSTWDGVSFAS